MCRYLLLIVVRTQQPIGCRPIETKRLQTSRGKPIVWERRSQYQRIRQDRLVRPESVPEARIHGNACPPAGGG